ncbi:MAG: metallophosphoesterase [Fidelibacterota bacterium]|nr:MAG: metallophosphoesterase [Candidatus Neomarinimicrobiota bacterium]
MRIAIISDTHFGDHLCSLVTTREDNKVIRGPKYEDFRRQARREDDGGHEGKSNDFLILLGDILDFSITSYERAYGVGAQFFKWLKEDDICGQIVYVPGNHDFDLWDTIEYEVNVINRVRHGLIPQQFRWSVPGVLDLRRASSRRGFSLPTVVELDQEEAHYKYGGHFFDNITGADNPIDVAFAYPNIYLVTDEVSVLLTHGQYFEPFWALLSEWALRIAQDDLGLGPDLRLEDLLALNFPISHLTSSGTGQAGVLTEKVLRPVQAEIRTHRHDTLHKYLGRLDDQIFRTIKSKNWLKGTIQEALWKLGRKVAMRAMGRYQQARFDERFLDREMVRRRFIRFYRATLTEIDELNREYGLDIPRPRVVVFGHIHEPTPWGVEHAPQIHCCPPDTEPVLVYNTGGWVYRIESDGHKEFVGAEVMTYSDEEGGDFRSHSIH